MEINVPSLLRIKPGALSKIGKYLKGAGWNRVAVFWGEGIKELFGSTVKVSFSTAGIDPVSETTVNSNDIENIFQTTLKFPTALDAVVALGGGKALDAGKYAAHVLHKPVAVIPTTISNDGFCSPGASLSQGGKRRSFITAMPEMVILDTEVLASAPLALQYSGIGDLFCKATAVWDWKYAFRTQGEPVNDFAAVIAKNAVDTFDHFLPKNLQDLEFLRIISSSLLMCGISMAIAGSSRPASGSEHLISHAYDSLAQKPSLHGLQVGVASRLVANLQKDTLDQLERCCDESGFWDFVKQNPLERKAFIQAIRDARLVKQNFATILDIPDAAEKLIDICQTRPEFQQVLDSSF